MPQNTLIVLIGPTGVGKTECSLTIAEAFACHILSSDSRQVYNSMDIGTAAPTLKEVNRVPHHFIRFLNPDESYNASRYEHDVLNKLEELFRDNKVQLLVGGSMMYVDAICKGIDDIPDVDPLVREEIMRQYQTRGLESIRFQLQKLDPETYQRIDLKNPARMIHAVEVCLSTGKPYSTFLTRSSKKRPFNIVKIGLNRERTELYERINARVLKMVETGLVDEVKALLPYRDKQALQSVGYREVLDYLDGKYDLKRAVELIQRNSRHYAKKQLTWFRRDAEVSWFHPDEVEKVVEFIKNRLEK